ncbi:retrotransposable element Tf2 protein type 1 [Trichonephila clavipes]|nr:retrotransposable element Tf2 protein type 1 [Trichonephila clavipes]
MIYRSSPAVVVLGRPPPTFLTAVPVVWNAFKSAKRHFVDSELCSYTGDCTSLLQLPDHSSTCEVVQTDSDNGCTHCQTEVEDNSETKESGENFELKEILECYEDVYAKDKYDVGTAGIIKESPSPYSAPVTLAYKKDDQKKSRLCIDFRKLNQITKSDAEPLPVIETLTDKLAQRNYFSKDMASVYWLIPIHPDDT